MGHHKSCNAKQFAKLAMKNKIVEFNQIMPLAKVSGHTRSLPVGVRAYKTILASAILLICSAYLCAAESAWSPEILKEGSKIFLPDYSYAGYQFGEKSIPELAPTASILDYGALPNDDKDDTEAIRKALKDLSAKKENVVLRFPKGRYIVGEIILIERGNLVLQGEGSGADGTVIFIKKPLKDMEQTEELLASKTRLEKNNKREKGKLYSPYSWFGGVFWFRYPSMPPPEKISAVGGALRGAHLAVAENPEKIIPGASLRVKWFNKEGKNGSLLAHVLGRTDIAIGGRLYENPEKSVLSQPLTVEAINGSEIRFKEPLLHDLRKEWDCALFADLYLDELGIEHMRFEFPEAKYAGHHFEDGYNALYMTDLKNSWINDVTVINADAPVLSDDCRNITIRGLKALGRLAHYNVHIGNSYGVLVTDFDFSARSIHSASFNTGAKLCVFSGGKISEGKLDQHCGLNHQNLFDDIEIGKGEDIFGHGGADYYLPTCGAFNTFWNIRVINPGKGGFVGSCSDAPQSRIVGLYSPGSRISLKYSPAPYQEGINMEGISVPSLYKYQLSKRLGKKNEN